MASSSSAARGVNGGDKRLGFLAIAAKSKQSFIHFFAMTGILLLSCRSLVQKYKIHDLNEDIFALGEEKESLTSRMNHIKEKLLSEAALEPTGAFAARLRLLFEDDETN